MTKAKWTGMPWRWKTWISWVVFLAKELLVQGTKSAILLFRDVRDHGAVSSRKWLKKTKQALARWLVLKTDRTSLHKISSATTPPMSSSPPTVLNYWCHNSSPQMSSVVRWKHKFIVSDLQLHNRTKLPLPFQKSIHLHKDWWSGTTGWGHRWNWTRWSEMPLL